MRFNIWKDCPKVPITELLSFIVDNRGKTVPTADDGWKLIATNCVTNNTLFPVYEKVRYLTQETYETWFRAHPMPGDILFVNKGTPGRVCLVPDPVDFCIAQDMIALRADDEKIYNKLLFILSFSSIFSSIASSTEAIFSCTCLSCGTETTIFFIVFPDTSLNVVPLPILSILSLLYFSK